MQFLYKWLLFVFFDITFITWLMACSWWFALVWLTCEVKWFVKIFLLISCSLFISCNSFRSVICCEENIWKRRMLKHTQLVMLLPFLFSNIKKYFSVLFYRSFCLKILMKIQKVFFILLYKRRNKNRQIIIKIILLIEYDHIVQAYIIGLLLLFLF